MEKPEMEKVKNSVETMEALKTLEEIQNGLKKLEMLLSEDVKNKTSNGKETQTSKEEAVTPVAEEETRKDENASDQPMEPWDLVEKEEDRL